MYHFKVLICTFFLRERECMMKYCTSIKNWLETMKCSFIEKTEGGAPHVWAEGFQGGLHS